MTGPALPDDHPRLGGWAELSRDAGRLATYSPWAAAHLPQLVSIEEEGLAARCSPRTPDSASPGAWAMRHRASSPSSPPSSASVVAPRLEQRLAGTG